MGGFEKLYEDIVEESKIPNTTDNQDDLRKKLTEDVSASRLNRFEEIMSEIMDLVEEAYQITRMADDRMVKERSQAYWRGHIHEAVGSEGSEYVGKSMYSMRDALKEMREEVSEE